MKVETEKKRVVVVGGGVIGAACAHFLSKAGWSVTIIDRDRFGAGSSDKNCGYVCPSHVLPLTEPGAVGKAMKSMFRRNSPLSVKPRFDPALWKWLFRFALRCNEKDMLEAGHATKPLLDRSMTLFKQLVADKVIDCEWQERGLLYVFKSVEAFEEYREVDRILADHFQKPATRLEGEALNDLEPALKSELAGGYHYEGDAHLRSDKLLGSWRKSLEAAGVAIRDCCELTGLNQENGKVYSVSTTTGEITVDAVVLATGALSAKLKSFLDCSIPIQPGKGYSLTMRRPAICPSVPMLFPETKVGVTPFEDSYRLASTMEFSGYDTSIRPERLKLLTDGVIPYLKDPFPAEPHESWFGWRPMTWDGLPIISRCPSIGNVILATGHNMLGLSMAPATGEIVAELLSGGSPQIDEQPYSIGRFQ